MNILRRLGSRTGMAVWLLGVWLLLWGRVDAATVLSGIVAAYGAYAITRLPTVPFLTRLRPVRLAEALLEFGWDLLASSVVIGKHALWRPNRVRGALVFVRARSRSDVVLLAVTTSMSLRPGTLVLDIDWERSLFLIHGMPVGTPADADSVKHGLLATERRLLRALGEPEPGGSRMTAVYVLTLSLLGAALALTTVRLLRGPTSFDRIMALDVLSVLLVSGIAVYVAARDEPALSTLLVVIAVLGFVGPVTAARLAGEQADRE